MPSKKICPRCHLPVETDGIAYRSKAYHSHCLDEMKAAARAKDEAKAAVCNDPELIALQRYIQTLFGTNDIPPLIESQIKQMRGKGVSYSDMLATLQYFYTIEKNEVPSSPTIGIIPYVLQEASEFYKTVVKANQANANFIKQEIEQTVRVSLKNQNSFSYHMEDL